MKKSLLGFAAVIGAALLLLAGCAQEPVPEPEKPAEAIEETGTTRYISGPVGVLLGEKHKFSISTIGTFVSARWYIQAGSVRANITTSADRKSATVEFLEAGWVTIVCEYMDTWLPMATEERVSVFVLAPMPDPIVIPSTVYTTISQVGDITIEQNASRSFSVSCNTAGYNLSNISWSVAGSVSGGNSANATITFTQPGKKTVTVSGIITKDGYSSKRFSHSFYAYVIQTTAPTITGPATPSINSNQTYTMNFTPAFANAQYHWSVSGGRVVSQSGNKATISFSQEGNQTVTGWVTQSSGSSSWTSPTGSYAVNVEDPYDRPACNFILSFDLQGSSFSCKLISSYPLPAGTGIQVEFELIVTAENGAYNDRVAVLANLGPGQQIGDLFTHSIDMPITKLTVDYSFFNIYVEGLVDPQSYYVNRPPLNRPSPLHRYDNTYRYVYNGVGGSYFPYDINFPAGGSSTADL